MADIIKFNRVYILTFKVYQRVEGVGLIPDPKYKDIEWEIKQTPDKQGLFVEWDITRDNSHTVNSATIKITNLPPEFREMLRKDNLSGGGWKGLDTKVIKVKFQFGYGETLGDICFMDLLEGTSDKSGTEWVTTLKLNDGVSDLNDDILTRDYKIFKGGTLTLRTALEYLLSNFSSIQTGIIDDFGLDDLMDTSRERVLLAGTSIMNCIRMIIPEKIGDKNVEIFIDNGKLHILYDDTAIDNLSFTEISEQTGLISPPVVKDAFIDVVTILEPRLQVGQAIRVKTDKSLLDLSKNHKVFSIKHKGDSLTGECTSTLMISIREGDFNRKFA